MCAECFSILGEARKQRSRSPKCLVGARLLGNALKRAGDFAQTHLIGVEHRSAAPWREAIAVQVHDVDVGTALCDAILHYSRAFVDQGGEGGFCDFLIAHSARGEAFLLAILLDDRGHCRIRDGVAGPGFVTVEARAGFLTKTRGTTTSVGSVRKNARR